MLEIFRKFQKAFFIVVGVMLICSFFFYGIFSALASQEEVKDEVVAKAVDGSDISFSSLQKIVRLLASEGNDEFLRKDFLETGIGALLAAHYFEPLKEDLQARWAQAKKYRPYAHPDAPFLSARAVWDQFYPELGKSLSALQGQLEVSADVFGCLAKLYLEQKKLSPEFIRRVLMYQVEQYPSIRADRALLYQDFSLFGYKNARDWFGEKWIEKAAEFVWNGALVAEEKGLFVSREEAKAASMSFIQRASEKSRRSLQDELRLLGMTERELSDAWCKVLLFRQYLHSIGDQICIDHLVARDVGSYAQQKLAADVYSLPSSLALKTAEDFFALQYYLDSVCVPAKGPLALPTAYLPLEEISKKSPECVETVFTAQVARVSKEEVALRISLQQVLQWAFGHWEALAQKFSAIKADAAPEERFEVLERLAASFRAQIDAWIRLSIVDAHPEWLEEAFQTQTPKEQTFSFSAQKINVPYVREPAAFLALLELASRGDEEAAYSLSLYTDGKSSVYRIANVQKVADLQIRPLAAMKRDGTLVQTLYRHLEKQYPTLREKDSTAFKTASGQWKNFSEVKEQVAWAYYASLCKALEAQEKWPQPSKELYIRHRLAHAAKSAWEEMQREQAEPRVVEQFQFVREEKILQRGVASDAMSEQAFRMGPQKWSDVIFAEEGQISFFYIKEQMAASSEDADFIAMVQTMLANEAMHKLAKHLIQRMQGVSCGI